MTRNDTTSSATTPPPTVRFDLGLAGLATVRFGVSPSYELCHAVRAVLRPHEFPMQWGWVASVRSPRTVPEFALLADVVGADGYLPDFLTTTPIGEWTPDDEIRALKSVPDDLLRRDLHKMVLRSRGARRERLTKLQANPRAARRDITAWWATVWEHLLAPYWPQLLHIIRSDIAVRARRNADDGIAAMIDSLHNRISWDATAVTVRMQYYSTTVDCTSSGLLLVPSVMTETNGCAVVTEAPATPTIVYPAYGVAPTWHHTRHPSDQSLAQLIGPKRAELLALLTRPVTGGQAASACSLSPATTSHHLTVLRNAGLAYSVRHGKSVVHTITPLGQALLAGLSH